MKKNSKVNWPKAKDLAPIRELLSSDLIMGSTVLGPEAPLVDRIKEKLCSKIVQFHNESTMTQKDLAEKLNVDEPEMSRILHYKLERYTIDRLLVYLEILYPNLKIEIHAA